MGSLQNGGWIMDCTDEFQDAEYIWPSQPTSYPKDSGNEALQNDDNCAENSCSKKRAHVEFAGPVTKAFREKMRRDRLNDRFVELCSYLPERPANTDKIVILSDATRLLNQLHKDSKNLKEKIESLQDTVTSLKADKIELREEKIKLKAEKEKMEELMKSIDNSPPFAPNPAFFADASGKAFQYSANHPPPMWQWVPLATMDTSRDHVLRPPVA